MGLATRPRRSAEKALPSFKHATDAYIFLVDNTASRYAPVIATSCWTLDVSRPRSNVGQELLMTNEGLHYAEDTLMLRPPPPEPSPTPFP